MNREFLKGLEITEEHIELIMKEHGKSVNSIKDKADKVDGLEIQIQDYQQQIEERDKQLKDLSKKAVGNDDLQKQIEELQGANKKVADEWKEKLQKQTFDYALDRAITQAQARNPKAVRALLDTENIKLDGDKLLGLEEQLEALKEKESYLFGDDRPAGLKGREPHPASKQEPSRAQNLQKQYDEAMQSGNMAMAVSLKNQLFQLNQNGE
ncbi:phage scaffolding protein [Ornithinibacillus xuwenensis]|uniref:Phage scaffolding protein n=1 Tax=Ornithinibacillus xuwenensis TaxID=3144668 RepID=A0ABU9XDL4_9BACI